MREVTTYIDGERHSVTVFLKEDGLVLDRRTFPTREEADKYADDWVSGKIQLLTE